MNSLQNKNVPQNKNPAKKPGNIDLIKMIKTRAVQRIEAGGCYFPRSWTAAQVTEHLRLSDNGMLQTLNGTVQPTHRPIDVMVPQLRATFLDFSTKLPSPDFIIPENITYDKGSLIEVFKTGRSQLAKAIKELDLSSTCFQPIFGEPTRYEVISFVIFHTQRHVNQVKRISEKLVGV